MNKNINKISDCEMSINIIRSLQAENSCWNKMTYFNNNVSKKVLTVSKLLLVVIIALPKIRGYLWIDFIL